MLLRTLTIVLGCLITYLLCHSQPCSAAYPASEQVWGRPLAGEKAYEAANLPAYKGWCRLLSPWGWTGPIVTDSAGVLVGSEQGLKLVSLLDGSLVWESPDWGRLSESLFSQEHIYLGFDDYQKPVMGSIARSSGAELWSKAGWLPLLDCGEKCWLISPHLDADSRSVIQFAELALCQSSDGAELRKIAIPHRVLSTGPGSAGPNDGAVLKLDDGFHCYAQDGSSTLIPSDYPGWESQISQYPGGFVCVEFETLALARARFDAEVARATAAGETPPDEYGPLPPVASCYRLSDGKLLWRRPFGAGHIAYGHLFERYANVSGDYILLDDQDPEHGNGLLVFRQNESAPCFDQRIQFPGNYVEHATDGKRLYILDRLTRGWSDPADYRFIVVNLADGSQAETVLRELPEFSKFMAAPGALIFAIGDDMPGSIFGSEALCCLELDAQGLPQAGSLSVMGSPYNYDALEADLLASPAPLQDQALMRRIVANGLDSLAQLLLHTPASAGPQLDALAQAAAYEEALRSPEELSGSPAELLCKRLKDKADPRVSELIIRWLEDPKLADLQLWLRQALPVTGGPRAAEWLSAHSPPSGLRHHQPDPLALPPVATAPDEQDSSQRSLDFGQPFLSSTGAKLLAYSGPGLPNDDAICLAVDEDHDGLYEEVLPTGQSCYPFSGDEAKGAGPLLPRVVAVTDTEVEIERRVAVYKQADASDPDANTLWPQLAGTQISRVSLKLADLRRDSDADGLTDVFEQTAGLDWKVADSDSDGVVDGMDGAPLSNPARMGPVERGISRALDLFFASENRYAFYHWWEGSNGNPLQVRSLEVSGAGAFDYAPAAGAFSLVRDTQSQAAWQESLQSADFSNRWLRQSMSLVWIEPGRSVSERYAEYLRLNGREPNPKPEDALLWAGLANINPLIRPESETEDSSGAAQDGADEHSILAQAQRVPDPGSRAAHVWLDFNWVGWDIEMLKLDGEWYPVSIYLRYIQ